MITSLKCLYLCQFLVVASTSVLFCGCQSAESGGNFSGFSNPLGSGVPTQSEPPIATLDPDTESEAASTVEKPEAESISQK